MLKEQKLYIELCLEKSISLTVEGNYDVDKFGNIIFKNKQALVEELNGIITDASQKIDIPSDEINEYLLRIYNEKSQRSKYPKESLEIISLLQELGENKKENKEEKESKDKIH